MGQIDGFMKYKREMPTSRDPKERLKDYKEIYTPLDKEKVKQNAARCMDCGVPFCHNGCPLGNNIPDFNEAVNQDRWEEAIQILSTIFGILPEGYVLLLVRQAACLASTMIR